MKTKDDILLEQAYLKILLKEEDSYANHKEVGPNKIIKNNNTSVPPISDELIEKLQQNSSEVYLDVFDSIEDKDDGITNDLSGHIETGAPDEDVVSVLWDEIKNNNLDKNLVRFRAMEPNGQEKWVEWNPQINNWDINIFSNN